MNPPQALRPDDIAQALLGFVNAEIMAPGAAIGAGDPFDRAGVDSLALLRVLVFVEATFGLWVPDEDLSETNVGSVDALARYIAVHRAV
jgi:acyl carrier protein